MEKLILWFAFILVCNWKLVKPVAVEPFNSNVTGNDVTNDALGLTPTQEYMNRLCSKKLIRNNRDAIIMSPWDTRYPPLYTTCTVAVEEREFPSSRFVVTFKSMALSGQIGGVCLPSRLDLFNGESTTDRISDPNGLCGSTTSRQSYETRTNIVTFRYETFNLQPGQPQYFEAVITPFHTGTCRSDEFKCGNGNCVTNNMLCDSYNNCGDDSDEKNCAKVILTVAAIVGIVIGCVVVVGIIVTIVICKCCCGICGYERL